MRIKRKKKNSHGYPIHSVTFPSLKNATRASIDKFYSVMNSPNEAFVHANASWITFKRN